MLGRLLGLVALALSFGAACGPGGSRDAVSAGVCNSPEAANTFDAITSAGCVPAPTFQICEVADGAVLNPDGTYTPPAKCNDPCAPGGYALRCSGETLSMDPPTFSPMPAPDPSLGCRVLPIPTPPNLTVYCCACGAGG